MSKPMESGMADARDGLAVLAPAEQEALCRRLLAVDELPERLALVGEVLRQLAPIDGYLFSFRNDIGNALVCHAVSLPDEFKMVESAYRDFRFLIGDAPEDAVRCFLSSKVIEIDAGGIAACHANTRTRFERWRMRSLVFVPILLAGEAVGVAMLFSQRERLDAELVAAISAIINALAKPLCNALQHSALSEGRSDYLRSGIEREQLIEFSSEASNLCAPDKLCQRLIERFLMYFPFDFALLFLVEDERLVARYWDTLKEELRAPIGRVVAASPSYELDVAAGAPAIVVLRKMTMNFPDAPQAMHFRVSETDASWLGAIAAEGIALRTIVHVPVLVGQRATGLLSCYAASRALALDKGQIRRMELLARFLGSAIENARLYTQLEQLNEKLREQAVHDPLTGVYNFGYLQADLDRRIHEHWRSKPGEARPLSLILLDIDHFKQFNDTFGHLAGNAALVNVSGCISRLARRTDVVCRYGGEEFVVIVSGAGQDGAQQFAERIREAVATAEMAFDGRSGAVTVSLGVAQYDGHESMARFIERADQALYRAKTAGRNRVELASPGQTRASDG